MAAEDTPKVAARRARLRNWIVERFDGSRKAFLEDVAKRGFYLDATEVSNLQNGKKSFGETKAEQVETAAGMPKDYLVHPLAGPPTSTAEAPLPDLLMRAHRALIARGPYNLEDPNDALAFSQAYVAAAIEHLNAFQLIGLGLSTDEAAQEDMRRVVEQDPRQKGAASPKAPKVSTR